MIPRNPVVLHWSPAVMPPALRSECRLNREDADGFVDISGVDQLLAHSLPIPGAAFGQALPESSTPLPGPSIGIRGNATKVPVARASFTAAFENCQFNAVSASPRNRMRFGARICSASTSAGLTMKCSPKATPKP